MKASWTRTLLLLLAVFMVVRLFILFSSDQIVHQEEARQGNMAHEILSGRSIHLDDFLYQEFEGSCLVDAWLVTAVSWLTNESGYSLKLVTLLVSFLIFLFMTLIIKEFAGKRAVIFAAAMFIFGPTYFITYHYHSIGGSLYGSLFNLVIFYCSLRLLGNPSIILHVLWGLLCSTGIFLNPSCLPGIFMSFLIVSIVNKRLLIGRRMLLFLAGFACLTMLLLAIFGARIPVLGMINELFLARDFGEVRFMGRFGEAGLLSKLVYLFIYDLPHAFYFKAMPGYGYAYYAAAALLFLAGIVLTRRGFVKLYHLLAGKEKNGPDGTVPALVNLYVLVYFILYLASDIFVVGSPRMTYYDIAYKYFFNVFPFVFIVVSFSFDHLLEKFARYRTLLTAVCCAAVVPAVVSTALLADVRQLTWKPKFRSYDYTYLGTMLPGRFTENRIGKAAALCGAYDVTERMDCIRGIAIDCRLCEPSTAENVQKAKSCCCRFPVHHRWLCMRGLGNRMHETYFFDLDGLGGFCDAFGQYRELCIRGYTEEIGDMIFREPGRVEQIFSCSRGGCIADVLGNMGVWVFNYFRFNPAWSLKACGKLEKELGEMGCAQKLAREHGILHGVKAGTAGGPADPVFKPLEEDFWTGGGFGAAWTFYPDWSKSREFCDAVRSIKNREFCANGVKEFLDTVTAASDLGCGRTAGTQ